MTVFLNKIHIRVILVLSSIFFPGMVFSQTDTSVGNLETLLILITVLLFAVSVVISLVAIYTSSVLRRILLNERKRKVKAEGVEYEHIDGFWVKLSKLLTRSTPIVEEESILMDHNYDGIRELDNHLPPWWKALFYFTIIWSASYLLVFHVFKVLPLSGEEYNRELAKADATLEARESLLSESIDENSVVFSDEPDILSNGESIFISQCIVCHAADGGGGVGPNLTDAYWLHGGSINHIFQVIKYGIPEKGMISWRSQLPPAAMRDVACYITTLKGTIPVNPKAPQGELYDENAPVLLSDKPLASQDDRPTMYSVSDTMDNIQIGRGLFSGSIRLNNGGPGCITCHHVTEDILPRGATIAPDLTNVYSRLDGKTIMKYATAPYHPTMQEAYKEKDVMKEEVDMLISFFEYVGTSTAHQQKRDEIAAGFLDRIKKNQQ